jgi:hypothetical protein
VSRKAKRKSGEPPGGRETESGAGEKPWARVFLVVGILLAFLTLAFAHATLRAIYIGLHRDDYVRDELVVSSMSSPFEDTYLGGQIASGGESVWVPGEVAGPDFNRLRELQREGRIKGHRIPVWYLPQETPWWLSGSNQVRVIHVSQFEGPFSGWSIGVAITAPMAIVSVLLLLYGLKQIGGRRGEPAT